MEKTWRRWTVGDIVEVFDLHSWKAGKIMKVLRNDHFVIRTFGAIQLKEFHVSSLRAQHSGGEDQWAMTDKVCSKKQINPLPRLKYATLLDSRADDITHEAFCSREGVGQDHYVSFFPTQPVDKYPETTKTTGNKRRDTVQLDGCSRRTKRALPENVDADPFSGRMVGNHCKHLPIKFRGTKLCKMDAANGNARGHHCRSPTRYLPTIEEKDVCSIGSCSANSLPRHGSRNVGEHFREISSSSDGASSSCPSKIGKEYASLAAKKVASNLHELELHAYQSTLQAFYASGPLSWEQEAVLTNLRLSLNITNEEHLLHLRNMLSA